MDNSFCVINVIIIIGLMTKTKTINYYIMVKKLIQLVITKIKSTVNICGEHDVIFSKN